MELRFLKQNRFFKHLKQEEYNGRMAMAFSRAAATAPLRKIDSTNLQSWEFSGFCQNREDGVIDYLTANIKDKNRYFVEIGSADGLENNSAWLAFGKKYSGVMIDGSKLKSEESKEFLQAYNHGVKHMNAFVDRDTLPELLKGIRVHDPDFFSLDIDGNDFYIMNGLLNLEFKPKVICVEYNSAYGPDAAKTIVYDPTFNYKYATPTKLYYGVSIQGWKTLFKKHGYQFAGIESNGVNAFFIDPTQFEPGFSNSFTGSDFIENFVQLYRHPGGWKAQFAIIKDMPFYDL
ncbi:MAG: hypothetical protein JWM39_826 [Parcubacteria group bacterium]|nr:hypothetical protein [Parcubacteria group bacterium]